jgi:exodeoxyribonuclease VII large subunit
MGAAWDRLADGRTHALQRLAGALRHLNPEAVLERGYCIVSTQDGEVVQSSAQLEPGDAVRLRFARGQAVATVTARDEAPG